ncbi:MAG: hypothetical protein RR673_08765 [Erysipelotrichaceae bacterium]
MLQILTTFAETAIDVSPIVTAFTSQVNSGTIITAIAAGVGSAAVVVLVYALSGKVINIVQGALKRGRIKV